MKDDHVPVSAVETPCIQICVIHPAARVCTGCLRTIDEISRWVSMSAEQRAEVVAELPGRRPLLRQRRGGRKGRAGRPGPAG